MTKAIAKRPSLATDGGIELTPSAMLSQAVSTGANVDVVERLMGLQERWQAAQARKAYNTAIAAARSEIPVILKENEKTGAGGSYKYEDLGTIARIVDPVLGKHGLSYRYQSESTADAVKVTCVITHIDGHSESNSLTSKFDTSGSKNAVQALGSTVTYLQRYTLKLALGIATSKDDDGSYQPQPQRQDVSSVSLGEDSLTKAKSRPIYDALIKELRAIHDKEALVKWALQNTPRIYSMHGDFQKFFRNEYADHLTAIREGVDENGNPVGIKAQLKASLDAEDAEEIEPQEYRV